MRYPLAMACAFEISPQFPGLVWSGDASNPMGIAANRSDDTVRSGAAVPGRTSST